MKALRIVFALLLILMLFVLPGAASFGQNCPNGKCPYPAANRVPYANPAPLPEPFFLPAPTAVAVLQSRERVGWFTHPDQPDAARYVHLYIGTQHRGVLDLQTLKFDDDDSDNRFVLKPAAPEPAKPEVVPAPRLTVPPLSTLPGGGPAALPAVAEPAAALPALPEPRRPAGQLPPNVPDGGVKRDEMRSDGRSHYTLNGLPADEGEVKRAFEAMADGPGLTDDSALPWVTVVGPDEAFTKGAVASAVRGTGIKARVKVYARGHKAVADFPPGAVYIQAPNGRLLATLATYDGPEKVKAAFDAAMSAYDSAKDPGPNKDYPRPDPPAPPKPDAPSLPLVGPGGEVSIPTKWLILAAVAAVVIYLGRRPAAQAAPQTPVG